VTSRSGIIRGVAQTWGRILTGRRPNLSIEITRECPLRCQAVMRSVRRTLAET
jgi:hypothetical protein